jgi:hypothetical protein
MKVNTYFDLEEFVPPQIIKLFGKNAIWFINPKVIELATAYREFFKLPVVINNWHTGGQFSYRGYRPPRVNIGAEYSQHKLGNAFDCNIGAMTEKQMFDAVKTNFEYFKKFGLTSIEDYRFTDGWLHSDVRPTNSNELLIVKPL